MFLVFKVYRTPQQARSRKIELMEDYAYILDYLPSGNPIDVHVEHRNKPIAQAIGEDYFMLLELAPKKGINLSPGERVYIGKGFRDKIAFIYCRIDYYALTSFAKDMLPQIVEKIVVERENVFIELFNIAQPITIKLHALELIPTIGKKHLRIILAERKKKLFKSYKDLMERAKISNPVKLLTERIIKELMGDEKYYLFVKPITTSGTVYLGYLPRMYALASSKKLGE